MLIIAITTVYVAVMVDNAIPVESGYGLHVFITGQFVQAGFSYNFGYLRVGVLAFQFIPLFFQRDVYKRQGYLSGYGVSGKCSRQLCV